MTVDNLDERVGVAMHQLPVETLAAIRRGGHTATSLIGQTADLHRSRRRSSAPS
jgi:hypothetical protein